MYQIKDYVNGQFVERPGAPVIDVINPATEDIIGQTYVGTQLHTQEAIYSAQQAQIDWSEVPAIERAQYLKKIATGIRERNEELTEVIIKEGGKTRDLASTEVFKYCALSIAGTSLQSICACCAL